MTHWSRPRRLATTEREHLAATLRALADELTAAHAGHVQQLLLDATGRHIPIKDSTVAAQPTNGVDEDGHPVQPDTPTERAALGTDPDTARVAARAEQALRTLRRLSRDTADVLSLLHAWDPWRSVAPCPRCGQPFDRRYARCQAVVNGAQCGSSQTHERRCKVCDEPQQPGQSLRGGRCNTCRMFLARRGHDRNTAARLALQSNLIVDGVAHA
jgi:hypothetical protein